MRKAWKMWSCKSAILEEVIKLIVKPLLWEISFCECYCMLEGNYQMGHAALHCHIRDIEHPVPPIKHSHHLLTPPTVSQ